VKQADIYRGEFGDVYLEIIKELLGPSKYEEPLSPRQKPLYGEMTHVNLVVPASSHFKLNVNVKRSFPVRFALAELVWFFLDKHDMSFILKYNKNMANYSDDGKTLYGAYGPRMMKQIAYGCIKKLEADIYTRQAVAAIYMQKDSRSYSRDIPCNCLLQFLFRDSKLSLHVYIRSSDVVTGLPVDMFHWFSILNMVANTLELTTGDIHVTIGSLHLYYSDEEMMLDYINTPLLEVFVGKPKLGFYKFQDNCIIYEMDMEEELDKDFVSYVYPIMEDDSSLEFIKIISYSTLIESFANRDYKVTR